MRATSPCAGEPRRRTPGAGPRPPIPLRPVVRCVLAALLAAAALLSVALAAFAAGPPYPVPIAGQRVYDTAGVFSAGDVAAAEQIIRAIEQRTGAQIGVYTQLKPASDTPELAEADARALMDQWGVGRRGFDDGLVILFDLDESLRHGQVQLYAGSGYRATYLSDTDRQRIYDQDMLPLLRDGNLGAALLAGLRQIDAATTPEHAATLERARILDALLGVAGVALALLALAWFLWRWWRTGRDPVLADDASVLMAGPPAELTPAGAALLYDGMSGTHTYTTALLDLASRGELTFVPQEHNRVAIDLHAADPADPALALNRARPLGQAEQVVLRQLHDLAAEEQTGALLEPDALRKLARRVRDFDASLEARAMAGGWFTAAPKKVIERWALAAAGELVIAIAAVILGAALPSGGLVLAGATGIVAGFITLVGAFAMPARTRSGALLRAMLKAYRRTLQLTMAQSRSMLEVVQRATLPWLETPDQALVWSTALGLQRDAQKVLERSVEDVREARPTAGAAWFPAWYGAGGGWSGGAGTIGIAPGLMAASAIPNVSSMFGAIGAIGSPSGGGAGGGFGGGGGGGGGGAGGGF